MNNHHTKLKGDIGVTFVIHDLSKRGFHICLPITEHAPFDLIAVGDQGALRIQVKYRDSTANGRMEANLFNAWGNVTKGCVRGERYSDVDVDYIALTNGDVVAYVKLSEISTNTISVCISRDACKNKDPKVRMVDDYQSI